MTGPLERLRAVAAREPPPAALPYLGKVRTRAYAVVDEDVERLRDAGLSEDEIFELTVSAAVAEGLRRLDAAARALG